MTAGARRLGGDVSKNEMRSAPWRAGVAGMAGVIVALAGLAMAAGGGWLLSLGGSAYYLIAGLVLIAAGIGLFRRRRAGLALYALFLVATAVWAVWEVGLEPWPLLPRLAGPLVVLVLVLAAAWPLRVVGTAAVLSLAAAGGLWWSQGQAPQPAPAAAAAAAPSLDWPAYGSGPRGARYSAAAQITPDNVAGLKVAWTYRTGERPDPANPKRHRFEATPLKIGDSLYFCTPGNRVVALDAETGRPRWVHDPKVDPAAGAFKTCRGVAYWAAPDPAATPVCPTRILAATLDARLIALDARTGAPCADFGDAGQVDLRPGLGELKPNFYYVTSAPTIGRDVAVVGGWITDSYSTDMPSGVIRGFDVRSGKVVWNWDPGRPDDTTPLPPGASYSRGAPNAWAPASVDEGLGLIFLPMGNSALDHWGGKRDPVGERFSAAIVALELATGKLRWVYQTVHHDLWDLDVPAQPTLVDLKTAAGITPALFAPTKRGDIFVLDRRTGVPVVPAPEKPVPQGPAPGDWLSPTQPFSALSFAPPRLRETDMWGISPLDQLWCRIQFKRARHEGPFTPQGLKPAIAFPGSYGVFNWGGAAVDEARAMAVINPSYTAFYLQLAPRTPENLARKFARPQLGSPYVGIGGPFLSPLGVPCQAPPWGELVGVDLATMKPAWRQRFGSTRDRALFGIAAPLGMPSLGGPILTASGVAFIAASSDDYLRAYEARTGKLLWRARLPAGGQATPMTYVSPASGRQFVVIAAGGHATIGSRPGDYVIAYSLPASAP